MGVLPRGATVERAAGRDERHLRAAQAIGHRGIGQGDHGVAIGLDVAMEVADQVADARRFAEGAGD